MQNYLPIINNLIMSIQLNASINKKLQLNRKIRFFNQSIRQLLAITQRF